MKAAFDREKQRIDSAIESAQEKFANDQNTLAKEVRNLKEGLETRRNRSHYLGPSTELRPEIKWDYRKASYAFKPTDAEAQIPELGNYFAVVQPGGRQALTVELAPSPTRKRSSKTTNHSLAFSSPCSNNSV